MRRDFDKLQARVDAGETVTALAAEEGVTKQYLSVALRLHAKKRDANRIGAIAGAAASEAAAKAVAKELRK